MIQNVRYLRDLDSSHHHAHTGYHQMIYVRLGDVTFDLEGRRYHVDRPSVVFISCHEQHAVTVHSEVYERYMLNVYPHKVGLHGNFRLLSVFSDRPSGFCHVLPLSDTVHVDALLSLLLDEFERQDSEFADEPERLLCSVLLALYRLSPDFFPRAESKRGDTVLRIKARLERELTDPPTLEELGREFHLSPYYLAHLFKDVTGYSIKNYHLLCRIAATRELLEVTDLSITDICARVGFADMSSLSRYFKREMGCTPSQYRKRSKNKAMTQGGQS